MMPATVTDPVAGFVATAERRVPARLAAVYVVGGAALGDFSPRQSNIDLVVVADPPLDEGETLLLAGEERRLERAGRPASVWYAGWDDIADGSSGDPSRWPPLETPLTRALLREEAVAYVGPDWPIVAYDDSAYRRWCRTELEELAVRPHGMLLLRRYVSDLVLEAARLAQGAVTGRVFSKSEAGESVLAHISPHFRRILHDSVGYRNGATTSMYYGPFERKYDVRQVIEALLSVVAGAD